MGKGLLLETGMVSVSDENVSPTTLDTSGGVGQQSSASIPESYLVRKG